MENVTINLLPWRDQRRKRQDVLFIGIFCLIVIIGLLLLGWQLYDQQQREVVLNQKRDQLEQQSADLANRRLELTAAAQSASQLVGLQAIQASQHLKQFVSLLQLLSRHAITGIYFQHMQLEATQIELQGSAEMQQQIIQFGDQLQQHGFSLKKHQVMVKQRGLSFAVRLDFATN